MSFTNIFYKTQPPTPKIDAEQAKQAERNSPQKEEANVTNKKGN